MKISILLPTRDRLDLLRHAVASITRLEDPDCEIVISDNCSTGDVEGYVASLEEARVRYVRAPELLSVTENWNNALAHSTGDYVLMLGDDDALLDGYFKRTRRLIAEFGHPQVIYHSALLYSYPGVTPGMPEGQLRPYGYAPFLRGADGPVRLPAKEARRLVRQAVNFRFSYGLNIQFVTISRRIAEELAGDGEFFRPPFPDYYAMNHLFARANSIVAEPHPLVVIGISARSHGFYCANDREVEGKAFLEGSQSTIEKPGQPRLLPGTNMNSGSLRTFEELHRQLGWPADLKPNYRRYRMLQILHVYEGRHLRGTIDPEQMAELERGMTRWERLRYGLLFALLSGIARILPARARAQLPRALTLIRREVPWWQSIPDPGHYRDISEVVERTQSADDPARWGAERGSRLGGWILERVFP
ncbi:MAG: glycosyltransferase family 2 protein [Solirubrobacteraceae bacterium]